MLAAYAGGPINPIMLDAVTTDVEVVNTTTATALYTYTLPANYLSTNNILRCTFWGDYLNDSGSSVNLTVDIRYGGSTLCTSTGSVGNTATRRVVWIQGYIKGDAATNAQRGQFVMLNPVAATVGGSTFGGQNTLAIDSTAAQDVVLRVTHGTAASTISFILRAAWIELIRNL